MKHTRDIALMATGAAMLMAYQKYNHTLMEKMENSKEKTLKKVSNKMEDMM